MIKHLAALWIIAASAQASAAPPVSPSYLFLLAADRNDPAAMMSLLKRDVPKIGGGKLSPQAFVRSIGNCYLRAVYRKTAEPHVVMAAWMCSLNPANTKSRVIMARIGSDAGGVRLWDYGVTDSDRPAPPRKGPVVAGK